jgi:hypothetical protein
MPHLPETVQLRQIRPEGNEIVVLRRMCLITHMPKQGGSIIIPNRNHPLVQAFYMGKPKPNAAPKLLAVTVESQKCAEKTAKMKNVDRAKNLTRPQPQPTLIQQPPSPSPTPTRTPAAKHTVNSSLDPRLQGREGIQAHATRTVIPTTYTGDETRLQQLEEVNLRLRMEGIVKDREIRRLKAEVEQLRGGGYETGNKRPRT